MVQDYKTMVKIVHDELDRCKERAKATLRHSVRKVTERPKGGVAQSNRAHMLLGGPCRRHIASLCSAFGPPLHRSVVLGHPVTVTTIKCGGIFRGIKFVVRF